MLLGILGASLASKGINRAGIVSEGSSIKNIFNSLSSFN